MAEHDLAPVTPVRTFPEFSPTGVVDVGVALAAWRAGKKEVTRACYAADLADFAAFVGVDPERAAGALLTVGAGRAHQVALAYLLHLQERNLASATVTRRLAGLRSLVRAARVVGLVTWTLELPTPRTAPYRDTRGPGRAGFMRLVAEAEKLLEPLRSRNLALLWLMYGRALRRSEVCGITYPEDLDLAGSRVKILGKHRADPEWVTIPPGSIRAITAWLTVRGNEPGPLFYRLDRAAGHVGPVDTRPLTGRGVHYLVEQLGNAAGVRARPHGLRHVAITEVLDVTGGDHRAAQKFGRLRSANVLHYYDDNREDSGGEAAKMIAP